MTDSLLAQPHYDYADSFEVLLPAADRHPVREWLEAGLETASRRVIGLVELVHRRLAGFDAPSTDGALLRGWRTTRDEDDVVKLEASGRLLEAVIVVRRVTPTRLTFTTFLVYGSGMTRWLWLAIRPVHKSVAQYLLRNAATVMTGEDIARPVAGVATTREPG